MYIVELGREVTRRKLKFILQILSNRYETIFKILKKILKCYSILKSWDSCEHDDFGNGLWSDELGFLFQTTSESGILLCVNLLEILNKKL